MGSDAEQVFQAASIHDALGIEIAVLDKERVELTMEVEPRVHQPMGLLHGGASAVIAESAASIGAYMHCKDGVEYAVGTDLNISHLRARSTGTVRAVATPIRVGRTLQVWSIDILDEDGRMVAIARCTLAVRRFEESST